MLLAIGIIFVLSVTALGASEFSAAERPIHLAFDPVSVHNLHIKSTESGWKLTITGTDPYIALTPTGFRANSDDVLLIKYRSHKSYRGEVYWQTSAAAGQYRSVDFPLKGTETLGTGALQWATIEVPIGSLSESWGETITLFRFDPSADTDIGELEVVSIQLVSRPAGSVASQEASKLQPGEFAAESLTGIDPISATRRVENRRFRVETRGSNLRFSRFDKKGTLIPVADISIQADASKETAGFSSFDFPAENLFCRFQDRWTTQVLSVFYQSATGAKEHINVRLDVSLEANCAPWLCISTPGRVTITPAIALKEVVLPGIGNIRADKGTPHPIDGEMNEQWIKLVVAEGPPIYLVQDGTDLKRLTVSSSNVSVGISKHQRLMLYSAPEPLQPDIENFRHPREYKIIQPATITLRPGITAVDATLAISRRYTDTPIEKLTAPIAFSTIISSDYMIVNLPVGITQVRVPIPIGARVISVRDAISNEDIPHRVDGQAVVFSDIPACTVRIKCDSLLDYRVMFTAPRPVDGGYFHEDFSNYYYPQWMFLWEGWIGRLDILNGLDSEMRKRPLPIFIGLHYGNHGPPGCYETFHKLHPDILQIDNYGQPHKGLEGAFGTPPWMCLVHPTLWHEISGRLNSIFETIRSKPWYPRVFGFGSTSEPWIVRDDNDPSRVFCYNPEHVKWFRRFEKEKWGGDLQAFNRTFGTSFASWDEVEPPRKVEESGYYNEWLLSKVEAVIASEEFYRGEIAKYAPNRPNYAHSAIMVIYNQIKNSNTPDIMHVGKDKNPSMFKEGGSLYCNEPEGQAFVADSIRAWDTEEACFPECYAPSYGELYSYLVGESGLFKKSFNMMIPGPSWTSGVQVGNAWPVFSEITGLVCLDLGDVPRPGIALVYDVISDNVGLLSQVHRALFERNVDRCVITTRMIERGWLRTHPIHTLVLPGVRNLSEKALEEIAACKANIVVLGDFAVSDYYRKNGDKFSTDRTVVLQRATRLENAGQLADTLARGENGGQRLIVYQKGKGILLYNRWGARNAEIRVPSSMAGGRVAVVSDTGQVTQLRKFSKSITVPIGGIRACALTVCQSQEE